MQRRRCLTRAAAVLPAVCRRGWPVLVPAPPADRLHRRLPTAAGRPESIDAWRGSSDLRHGLREARRPPVRPHTHPLAPHAILSAFICTFICTRHAGRLCVGPLLAAEMETCTALRRCLCARSAPLFMLSGTISVMWSSCARYTPPSAVPSSDHLFPNHHVPRIF